uniref:extensin-like n=1 Tax=Erigeron canadensis TaxID=72917 RepID=UPI001CB965DA|nr:extensin-like [Erigeron canadensis]
MRSCVCLTIALIICSTLYHVSNASQAALVGTVYCDTCFNRELSGSIHFISGALVAVECGGDGSTSSVWNPRFREEVKTNGKGEFKVKLPFSPIKHVNVIKGCSVNLIRSGESECAMAVTKASTPIRLKMKTPAYHVFSAGFFTFQPLVKPRQCHTRTRNQNSNDEFSTVTPSPSPVDGMHIPPMDPSPSTIPTPPVTNRQITTESYHLENEDNFGFPYLQHQFPPQLQEPSLNFQSPPGSMSNRGFQPPPDSMFNLGLQSPPDSMFNLGLQPPPDTMLNPGFLPPPGSMSNTGFQPPPNSMSNLGWQPPPHAMLNPGFLPPPDSMSGTGFQPPRNSMANPVFQPPADSMLNPGFQPSPDFMSNPGLQSSPDLSMSNPGLQQPPPDSIFNPDFQPPPDPMLDPTLLQPPPNSTIGPFQTLSPTSAPQVSTPPPSGPFSPLDPQPNSTPSTPLVFLPPFPFLPGSGRPPATFSTNIKKTSSP